MISVLNDPISTVLEATMRLFPELDVEVLFVDSDAMEVNSEYGCTMFPDGEQVKLGIVPGILVRADIPLEAATEILAHELAHVVAGPETEHGPSWWHAFTAIHEEYCKLIEEKLDAVATPLS